MNATMKNDTKGKEYPSLDTLNTLVNDKIAKVEALRRELGPRPDVYPLKKARQSRVKGRGQVGRGGKSRLHAKTLIAEFRAKI